MEPNQSNSTGLPSFLQLQPDASAALVILDPMDYRAEGPADQRLDAYWLAIEDGK